MKHVRVTLEQRDGEDEPAPLVIDLVLGTDRRPVHPIPYAGWWGKTHGIQWLHPLIFQPNGVVDWGGDPETPNDERYTRMPVHQTEFTLGERIRMTHLNGDVNVFVVKRLIDLTDLQDVAW